MEKNYIDFLNTFDFTILLKSLGISDNGLPAELPISNQIGFVAFFGSRNYGTFKKNSDFDFFVAYYPSFDDFYHNKFKNFSIIKENYDAFILPIKDFIYHSMKGNIKFIEPVICNSLYVRVANSLNIEPKDSMVENREQPYGNTPWGWSKMSDLLYIDTLKNYININYKQNFYSAIGIAKSKVNNIINEKYTSSTLIYKERYGYDIKEAFNALRILWILKNYILNISSGHVSDEFDFLLKNNPKFKSFLDIYKTIEENRLSKKEFLLFFDKNLKEVILYKDIIEKKDKELMKKRAKLKEIVIRTLIADLKKHLCRY